MAARSEAQACDRSLAVVEVLNLAETWTCLLSLVSVDVVR